MVMARTYSGGIMSLVFNVQKEVDFIALAPIVLGFYPHDSLVMLTLSGFHARVDLPGQDDDDVQQCIKALLEPALKHSVTHVAVLTYDAEDVGVLSEFIKQFSDADIEVVSALEVRPAAYRRIHEVAWKDFDIASHPFTLEAYLHERAPRESREDLVASIQPRGEGWRDDIREAVELLQSAGIDNWVRSATRENAVTGVKLWATALRGAEPDFELVSDIALLVSLTAWLSGDGALAWAALDLADSSTTLYHLIYATLDGAVSPNDWPVL